MSIQDNFRLAMRRYIYSVSIMSNKDNADNLNAITVSSVTSISMNPPSSVSYTHLRAHETS